MKKVWFITGSSRGLGRQLTEAVLAQGDRVAATARQPESLQALKNQYPDQLELLTLDVTNPEQIQAAVTLTVERLGRIDVLVNNAGFGIIGAAEAFTEEQVRSQLETNLYAPIAITRAVLPVMRKQRSGRILQISSVGGRVGAAGLTMYQAAKFGLGGFTEALVNEVVPLGIQVTSVEPGGFRTDWAGASMTYATPVEGYETSVGQRAEYFASGQYIPMGDPAKAAQVLIDVVNHPEPPIHLILGSEAASILQEADARRKTEFEAWLPVSVSTDHDDSDNFLDSELGQTYLKGKA
ncbi:oxidoreductase [Siphonobacter curvatus]|uniref:Short-chain dehydrogenase/reductase n=1 Tax=Siphonobacter curvatus TaxID=2094562 RepID=A0A2S7IG89_9BACT|nr:oxidoreductase [Siphonobacter curvatus]PQA54514.1 short-chain dehydrogenase/reductase [Siphonobacter curvatus]